MPATKGQVAAIAVERARRLRSRSARPTATHDAWRVWGSRRPVDKNAPLLEFERIAATIPGFRVLAAR
jgi:hypothetical protein